MTPLTVVTHDPRYGGGGLAQLEAFLAAARAIGREPEVLYVPHPTLRPELHLPTTHRVEALRLLLGSRMLARRVPAATDVWVVTTQAQHGLAARLAGARYACWIGTSVSSENPGRLPGLSPSRRLALRTNAPALRLLERAVLRGSAAVHATSPASRAEVATAAGIGEEAVGILPIPVDPVRFVPLPDDEWRASLAAPVIAFVGRGDDTRKNVRLLLEALPEIRRRLPGTTLRLIGRPPTRPLPEGAEALGPVPSVGEELRRCALLVLPSLQEGFGIVVAEALACGVPVLSTPCGGPEQLVRDSGGGRVLTGWSAGELAAATVELLTHVDTLIRMRSRGRAYVVAEQSPARLRERLAGALVDQAHR